MTGDLAEGDLARLARGGIVPLSSEEGLELFDAACSLEEAFVLPLRLDRATLGAWASTGDLPPLLRGIVRRPRSARRAEGASDRSLALRLAGVPDAERKRVVLELVRSHAAAVLGHAAPEAVDPERAFKELGFDSLTAVELRNRLSRASGMRLPATLVFDYPTSATLADHLLAEIGGDGVAAVDPFDSELDELERRLSSIAADDAGRTRLTVRLGAFLAGLNGGAVTADDDDVRSATAEDIFDLIDTELEL